MLPKRNAVAALLQSKRCRMIVSKGENTTRMATGAKKKQALERHTYQDVLINAARTMVRVSNPRHLLKMITRFIVKEAGLTHAAILIHEPARNRYIFVDSKGGERIPTGLVRIDQSHPLIEWFMTREFRRKKNHLSFLDISKQAALSKAGPKGERNGKFFGGLQKAMSALRANICVPGFYKGELLGILVLGEKTNAEELTEDEIRFFQALANDASIAIKAANLRDDLLKRNLELELQQKKLQEKIREVETLREREQSTYHQIVLSLAREVYAKDPYTSDHLEDVQHLGFITAQELGYDLATDKKKKMLGAALCLHDVGKIGIPDDILKKESALTEKEWKVMKQHPSRGSKILSPLSEFKEVGNIILHHHENYDGSGYPDGLRGEDIPLESRIVAVVDAFHAMTSTRCYRKACSKEEAIQELLRVAGTQFDPKVVEAFIRAHGKEEQKKLRRSRKLEASLL